MFISCIAPPALFTQPEISVIERLMELRCGSQVPFHEVLSSPLPFKIPVFGSMYVNQFPDIFEIGVAEYGPSVDTWLHHRVQNYTSEMSVAILDGNWQNVLKSLTGVAILLDEHDLSSQPRLRPDFTAMYDKILVMKGEAKATLFDMMSSAADELVSKFHTTAYRLFPEGSRSIPAITSCNEAIALYSISYFQNFISQKIKHYDVTEIKGRVAFIVDVFKIVVWILSQKNPIEGFHLTPSVRTKTRNGHHVTLLQTGILKEFDSHKVQNINMNLIRAIYELRLPNIEHGTTNCNSITITRVGSKLVDAFRVRGMDTADIFKQVQMGINQLHSNGFAHCDICVDNIFVDSIENGGGVFLGDLEYCHRTDDAPPRDIRRADERARTAQELDLYQLEKLKGELATM